MSLSFIEFIDFAIVVLLILLPIAFSILPFTFAASIVASHANVSENFAFDSSLHPSVYHIISQSFTHTSSHNHQKNFSYHASAIRPNVGASSVSANSFSVSLSTVIGACVSPGHRSTHAGVNSIHTLKAVLIKSNAGTCDLSKYSSASVGVDCNLSKSFFIFSTHSPIPCSHCSQDLNSQILASFLGTSFHCAS